MKLKEVFNKSYYGSIGYISKEEDLELLEQYILYNLNILKEFKNIITATNFGAEFHLQNEKIWKKYFPECVVINSPVNRGHNHGNADLDNLIFNYCKENHIDWLCKSANDVIFDSSVLDLEIKEADFYYLNGIGLGGMDKYNHDVDRIVNEDFYPQTNFYIINVSKTDFINDSDYLDETYDIVQQLGSFYNGRIWEYIEGWSCEHFLRKCIERNKLSKYHLVTEEKYRTLIELIKINNIHDCSHKNIMIEGICHFQFHLDPIIKI